MYKKGCCIFYEKGDLVGPYKIELIDKLYQDSSKKWHYNFKCPYCGNIFESVIGNIKQGKIRSCGCYKHNKFKSKIVGQKFGKLTVLEETSYRASNRSIIWKCLCDCGNIVFVDTNRLKTGNTQSCGCLKSKGENKIIQLLTEMNISFIHDKPIFKDCINPNTNHSLRFDFYLPDYNCCIEYDGKQHFKEYTNSWEKLSDIQFRDNIKNQYCKQKNIKLIRISYLDYNNLTKNYLYTKLTNKRWGEEDDEN